MSQPPTISPMHTAICVADLEAAENFYTQALGFVTDVSMDGLGAPLDTLLEVPGAAANVRQMQLGNMRIELVGFSNAEVLGDGQRRPTNHRGLTHLTFQVSDIDAAVAAVTEHGGQAHPETRVDAAYGSIVFCTDPDGTRIELMQPPAG